MGKDLEEEENVSPSNEINKNLGQGAIACDK